MGRLAFLSNTREVKIQLNLLTHDVLCGKDLCDDSFLPASQKEILNKFNTVVFYLTNRTETWIKLFDRQVTIENICSDAFLK